MYAVSRPSFRESGQLVVTTMQPTHQRIPNMPSTGHRLPYSSGHASNDALSQDRGANPRNVHGIRLRPVSELRESSGLVSHTYHRGWLNARIPDAYIHLLPSSRAADIYRGMFKFGVFNAVQSKCFDTVCIRVFGFGCPPPITALLLGDAHGREHGTSHTPGPDIAKLFTSPASPGH